MGSQQPIRNRPLTNSSARWTMTRPSDCSASLVTWCANSMRRAGP